jgi:hypothetical protein
VQDSFPRLNSPFLPSFSIISILSSTTTGLGFFATPDLSSESLLAPFAVESTGAAPLFRSPVAGNRLLLFSYFDLFHVL